jgi:hypothetical protein
MRASSVQARSLPRPEVESSYQPRSWPRSWAKPAVGDGDDDQDDEEPGRLEGVV